jgi:RNA polymerase sigma-70 factor, ECF subfamily
VNDARPVRHFEPSLQVLRVTDDEKRAPELDDLTLARARRGEVASQALLIERYGRPVYALVSRMMVGRRQLVDDLAQESLVKVLAGLPRFDPAGRAKLSTWILTVATRVCIDAQRRERPTAPLDDAAVMPGADPEQLAGQRQLTRRVVAAMAQLPADQRAVLVLRAYHDFDYDEISQALGVEEGTVKSRLGRARQALRRALELPEQERVS